MRPALSYHERQIAVHKLVPAHIKVREDVLKELDARLRERQEFNRNQILGSNWSRNKTSALTSC